MIGFFDSKELSSSTRADGKIRSCSSCGLYKGLKHPRMAPYGNFRKRIMNIGEAPGMMEDEKGVPWQGKIGQLLQRTYRNLGIDLFEDCVNINACHCRPIDGEGDTRVPTNFEIESCRRTTLKLIEQYQPSVIILLGGAAVHSLIEYRWKRKSNGITQWRGWTIPDLDFNTWICPTFHPSYVQRSDSPEIELIWSQDLENAINKRKEPLPVYVEPVVIPLEDLSPLDEIQSGVIAFDYETTGLKPHSPGHRIICASIAIDPDHAYVFMMPETRRSRLPFIRLLENTSVRKMAHNMKFEDTWSRERLRAKVEPWGWDSMLAAHLLDNRPGVTSLKFQAYVNFGVVDYSSDVDGYLQSTDGKMGANSMNRIQQLITQPGGTDKLLKYCGLDSVYEYRLAMLQKELIFEQLPF